MSGLVQAHNLAPARLLIYWGLAGNGNFFHRDVTEIAFPARAEACHKTWQLNPNASDQPWVLFF